MTFRIDEVGRIGPGQWSCTFKGVDGKGIYGAVVTNEDGRGLFLVADTLNEAAALLPAERFHVPSRVGHALARERFATAFLMLGWGPEVDDRNEPV